MLFGEYLINKKIIDADQLDDALKIQKVNPQIKIGEIVVSQGSITQMDLINLIESYIKETGANVTEMSEWLKQEEADALIRKLKAEFI